MRKAERHNIIKKVITEHNIENQQQLVEYLENEHVAITQATISRDIRELNIVKSHNNDGKSYYRILNTTTKAKKKISDEEKLINVLSESATDITQVEFMNIITAFPGNGQIIGVLIDSLRSIFKEIVACLAGDDTVLIISKSKEEAQIVNEYFKQYI
ncbi:arginine repressor [Vagococcus xieshaowenii]|uniref:Arginine repressor n=1 Tax=Vagococcus xieshaowenii TaxID=2562451 RepID=A0A4Z0DCI9_9ENTE|nr:ArgR family transcriptional regulator [Vagococcus xieshaowenii]QCA28184.1 ArgR family transcriptional regulator [Vagococcus xieshaowenii]TFZ42537.1 ArgR family transcriptional regulator [Vagococcus xieshaowenii]